MTNIDDKLNDLIVELRSLYYKVSDECEFKEDLRYAIGLLDDVGPIWEDEDDND